MPSLGKLAIEPMSNEIAAPIGSSHAHVILLGSSGHRVRPARRRSRMGRSGGRLSPSFTPDTRAAHDPQARRWAIEIRASTFRPGHAGDMATIAIATAPRSP